VPEAGLEIRIRVLAGSGKITGRRAPGRVRRSSSEGGFMAFFTWKDQFSVNNEEMDSQHKMFFEYLNQMFDAVQRFDKEENLGQMFEKLTEYADHHFKSEESLMRKISYPDLATQQQQHAFFISRLKEFKNSYRSKQFALPESTFAFMKDWLLEHILQEDMKYGNFLQ
jgi:hemerythrin-like metal-binding protein